MSRVTKRLAISLMMIILLMVFSACSISAGEDAYQIALKNGFSGTEAEWLESIKGKDGKEGVDGVDGINGVDGKTLNSDYTAKDLYNDMIADGSYTGTYVQFIKEFFSIDVEEDQSTKLRLAINKGLFSSCNVICSFVNKDSKVESKSGGSGVFYRLNKADGDAYVITNFHVVYNSKSNTSDGISESIELFLYGDMYFQRPIAATFVGGSSDYDIAVLRVSKSETLKNSDVIQATFSDSELVAVGDTVFAVGNPQSEGTAVNQGMINVDYENLNMDDVYGVKIDMRVIRIDAAVNPGNSGGGLFDLNGNVVGIVNAKLVDNDVDNVGYAIPSNIAKRLAESIIYYCTGEESLNVRKAQKPILGITVEAVNSRACIDAETHKVRVLEDVSIQSINENSLVNGVLKVGDLIKSFTYNGTTFVVNRKHILADILLSMRKGDTFEMCIARKDETSGLTNDLTVTIEITEEFMSTIQ